jgi:hypothetical protein
MSRVSVGPVPPCLRATLIPVSTPFPSNEVFLQSTISRLFPNSTLTVTQDFNFNLLGFAASNPDKIVIRELEDLESLKKVSFIPPRRRREGENGGSLVQGVILGGWRVGWGDQEVVAIVASVSQSEVGYRRDPISRESGLEENYTSRRRQGDS